MTERVRGALAAKFILLQAFTLSNPGCDNAGHFQFDYCKVRDLLQGLHVDTSGNSKHRLDMASYICLIGQVPKDIFTSGDHIGILPWRWSNVQAESRRDFFFIPGLLNSEREWWKEHGGLPTYRQTGGWYFCTGRLEWQAN